MNALLPALLLAVPAAAQAAPQHSAPPVFQDLSFEAARAQAAAAGRLFILDAMTSWCGPCKTMDKTTWVDPLLEDWIEQHGLAIQLDMDEHEDLKQQLAIKAFPTIIAFKGAEEFDRIVGLRNAPDMLEWLLNARAGKREIDGLRAELEALRAADPGSIDIRRLAPLASQLAYHGLTEEALELVLPLWAYTPADAEQRAAIERWRLGSGRFLTRDLIKASAPGRMSFKRIRAAHEHALEAGDESRRDDWIEHNFILGDESPTIAWAVALAQRPEARAALKQRRSRLFDLLVDAGQWAAAGHALDDPVAEITWRGQTLGAYDEPRTGMVPAIPMGVPSAGGSGMTPAIPLSSEGAPQTVPAIPLTRPAGTAQTGEDDSPKVIPAIPLTKPRTAPEDADDEAPKKVPAIPMIPLRAPGGQAQPAIPMVPMGGAPERPKRPETPAEIAGEVRARLTAELRRVAARHYGALLAAERNDVAAEVASTALEYAGDSGTRAGLVAAALRAGCFEAARERHLEWLDTITFAR